MNRLTRIERDARENQIYRENLLAQPDEFFRPYLGGVPDLVQKIHLVERLIQSMGAHQVFVNDVYVVRVRNIPPMVHLDITRHDGQPCTNWRDFQAIKNELVGPECEGVELFPAESRLVDTANQYHIWASPDTNFRFPYGYQRRLVLPFPTMFGVVSSDALGAVSERSRMGGDSTATMRPMSGPAMPC